MKTYPAKRNPNRCPTHPGALLAEVRENVELSRAALAKALDLSPSTVSALLKEKKQVSAAIAARLGKALGNGPGVWLRMQAAYDTWHAERNVDVRKIKPIKMP